MNKSNVFVCSDCRFFHGSNCYHRNAYQFDSIRGKGGQEYASVMRLDLTGDLQCGPSAKFFEPRMPEPFAKHMASWWRRS